MSQGSVILRLSMKANLVNLVEIHIMSVTCQIPCQVAAIVNCQNDR